MTTYSRRPAGTGRSDFLGQYAQVLSIAAFFVFCFIAFSVSSDAFFSSGNLLNLLRQSAPMLIVAVAMTFVITTGGIDLSVGSTVGIINALAAVLLQMELPWPVVIVLLLVVGAAVGLVQGWFVAVEAIPSFIVTLAGLSILRGLALLMTQGFSIPISPDSLFVQIGRGWFAGVPFPAAIAVIAVVFGYCALHMMQFGRHVVAIGANMEAARRAGIPVKWRIVMVYVLTGVAAALAGIIIAARLGSGSSNAAVGFELDVIAAVVLGGTSLMGGKGTIVGTVLGAHVNPARGSDL